METFVLPCVLQGVSFPAQESDLVLEMPLKSCKIKNKIKRLNICRKIADDLRTLKLILGGELFFLDRLYNIDFVNIKHGGVYIVSFFKLACKISLVTLVVKKNANLSLNL